MKIRFSIAMAMTMAFCTLIHKAGADTVWLSSLNVKLAEQGWGKPSADKSVGGQPMSIRGRTFEKGFGTHTESDLYVNLKGTGERFTAWVGVDDEANPVGRLVFVVMGDGKELWKSGPVGKKDEAKLADVNVKGVRVLQLHVEASNDGGAHADWAEAKIDYSGEKPETISKPNELVLPEDWKRSRSFNAGWRFLRLDKPDMQTAGREAAGFDDSAWESVVLPHNPRVEKRDERHPFQGVCWYRHTFSADTEWRGKLVSIQFGAAMQIAEVWVNGELKTRHLGGYLPFSVDISGDLKFDGPNVVAVRLDNRDTKECPPGTPTGGLDFAYPGGLYRGASIVVTQPVHISDAVEAGVEAGGGIFVQYRDVTETKATVVVKTHVVNDNADFIRRCRVVSVLKDAEGGTVAKVPSLPVMVAGKAGHEFKQEIVVPNPRLWHPDRPSLYTLETWVMVEGDVVDRVTTRIGIRTFSVGKRLLINGKEFRISGSNRHQEYPYIEYAISPNGAYRDAKKIKEGGFNFVRLSHYPQDPAFLDACDELGILVQAAVPGWQYFAFNQSFVEQSFKNIRQMIRRDRNHPSIVFWEPNLNETAAGQDDWQRTAHEITHAEVPGPECYTFGDPYPQKKGWMWDISAFAREYGDFGFGGNESTSRHLRGEGERALLQQAWNYQWCFNNMSRTYKSENTPWLGCATWVMFDYNRGYYQKPCTCGMMDIMRLPKFVYYFFQSQRDPALTRNDIESGPVLFVANYWDQRSSPAKVVVYSNCDEVELALNGQVIRRQKPDSGPDTRYSQKEFSYATVGNQYDSSGGNPFDHGNALHLDRPPFTFADVPYAPGTLTATGYLNGKPVIKREVRTPEKPARLLLSFDTAGRNLAADGADSVFVRAAVLDQNGTVVPGNDMPVTLSVKGPARLLGQNPVQAEAGIASILLQADVIAGAITVTAQAPGLAPVSATIISSQQNEGVSSNKDGNFLKR